MDMRHTFTVGLIAAVIALVPLSSDAGLGLDVSPAKLEISFAPGTVYNLPVTIHNNGSASVHVLTSMNDFTLNTAGDYQFTKPGTLGFSLMKFATVNPREFDLPADSSQQVRLTLSIPNTASISGEFPGIVFFQTRPERHGGVGVAFSAKVATKIYAQINGTIKTSGRVLKFASAKNGSLQNYRVLFANTGNAHVYLNGRVEIRHNGELVDRISLGSSLLVERGGERLIEVTGKHLEAGHYDAIAAVDYGGEKLVGGQLAFDTAP